MFIHNFSPTLFDFGIFQIRWYSLAYIVGILIGWWYGKIIIKKKFQYYSNYLKNFDDLILYLIIGIIVGGRLGYVLFYNASYYLDNFVEIFKIWKGGMSFHGGLVGVAIAIYFFSRLKKLNYKIYFDIVSCISPIGICFGRIANFINGELYGIPTNKSWGVVFPSVDNILRHPSQIYEAILEGFVLFFILNFLILKKNIKSGLVSSLFLILYGIFRIISEQFREPDEHLGHLFQILSMGTLLSSGMIIFGLFFLLEVRKSENSK